MQRYDTYKDSGVKWLGEIPSHWEVISTKYIAKLYTGNSLNDASKEKYSLFSDDSYPYIASKDISLGTGTVDYDNGLYIPKDESFFEIAPKNSFLLCIEGGSAGRKKAFLDRNCCFVNKLCCFDSALNPKYHYYFIQGDYFRTMFNCSLQGMIGGVSVSALKNIYTIVPPLEEQTAIANYLDTATAKIDAAIAQQQKMIDLLNERKQIIINRAVTKGLNPNAKMKDSGVEWIGEVPEGWGCRKLKSICANTQYSIKTGPFGSQLKGDDIQEFGDVPIYNQRVVIDNDCSLFNSYVSKAKAASLKSFVVNSKDLLITTRGTIGKSTIVPNDAPDGILHPCIIAIRLNFDLCCNEYLQFFFQSIAFNTDMMLSNATTIEVIYSYNLKECFVPLPPIDEQKQIVEYLNKELVRINQTIDATNNQISLLQERKQIVINEVVTGKIRIL